MSVKGRNQTNIHHRIVVQCYLQDFDRVSMCFLFMSTKDPLFFLFGLFASVWQPSQNPGDTLAGTTINKRYIFDSRASPSIRFTRKTASRCVASSSAILLYHIVIIRIVCTNLILSIIKQLFNL